jgi:hypothetical protein
VKLDGVNARFCDEPVNIGGGAVHKYSDHRRSSAHGHDDLSGYVCTDATLAAAIEVEPDRVGACIDGGDGIVDTGEAADFELELHDLEYPVEL